MVVFCCSSNSGHAVSSSFLSGEDNQIGWHSIQGQDHASWRFWSLSQEFGKRQFLKQDACTPLLDVPALPTSNALI